MPNNGDRRTWMDRALTIVTLAVIVIAWVTVHFNLRMVFCDIAVGAAVVLWYSAISRARTDEITKAIRQAQLDGYLAAIDHAEPRMRSVE
jgi:predicted membrane protein